MARRRRNPPPVSTLLFVGAVGVAAFVILRKRSPAPVKFFKTPRWSSDAAPRLLGEGCFSVDQQAFVDMSMCPGTKRKA